MPEFQEGSLQTALAAEFKAVEEAQAQAALAAQAESDRLAQEEASKTPPPSSDFETDEQKTAREQAESQAQEAARQATTTQQQEPLSEDHFFEKHFKELEFDNIQHVKDVIKNVDLVYDENKTLKSELEKLKANPQFADENEKKIFEFVKKYNQFDARGKEDYVRIDSSDPDSIDGKEAMKLAFVLSRKEVPRHEAERDFEILFKRTYLKPLEQLVEGTEEYEEEKDYLNTKKREEERKARFELKTIKEQYGQKAITQTKTPEQLAAEMVVERGIEESVRSWDENLHKMTSYTFKADGIGDCRVDVGEEERRYIDKLLRPIYQSSSNYDSNGKLKGNIHAFVDAQVKSVMFDKAIQKVATDVKNATLQTIETQLQRQPDPLQRQAEAGGQISEEDKYASALADAMKRKIYGNP